MTQLIIQGEPQTITQLSDQLNALKQRGLDITIHAQQTPDTLVAYTDGSYQHEQRLGSWAVTFEIDGQEIKRAVTTQPINVESAAHAELLAAARAVQEAINQRRDAIIYMDFESGVHAAGQIAANTRAGRGFAHPNSQLRPTLQRLHDQLRRAHQHQLTVQFHHVRGHAGLVGNERAHRLASRALKQNPHNGKAGD